MIKKIFALILFILGTTMVSFAAPLSDAQKKEVLVKLNNAATGLKTMSCDFVQTKHLSMLSEKMVSKGKMYYKQPDKLRWEYTTPYQYLFIFNGTKVYVGNSKKKDVIDTNSNRVFKEVARIMMNTVTGKALNSTSDFTVTIDSDKNNYLVTLVPKKKDLRQMFSKVVLYFSKSNLMIAEINIHEKNGDWTNIKLSNVAYNKPVNETLFAIP